MITSNLTGSKLTSKIMMGKQGYARIRDMLLRYLALIVLSFSLVRIAVCEAVGPLPGRIELRGDSTVAAGSEFVVSIYLDDSTRSIAGYNFYIEFDYGAFVLDSATLGSHNAGQWEYFTVRSGLTEAGDTAGSTGFIQLMAIADGQDTANKHPDPSSLKGSGEIAKLHLYASEHRNYLGKPSGLKFRWRKCSDNSMSDESGNHLMLARAVYDDRGKKISADGYSGPAAACFTSTRSAPTQDFDFRNLEIRIE